MKYLGALLIWLVLVLLDVAGLIIGLLALPFWPAYTERVFRMHDRTAAAVLGYSGENTVSKECGRSECRFCKIVCRVVGWLLEQPDHCKQEAK